MRVINKISRNHTTFDGEMNFAVLSFVVSIALLQPRDLDRETYGLFVKNNSTCGIVPIPPGFTVAVPSGTAALVSSPPGHRSSVEFNSERCRSAMSPKRQW